MLGYLPADIICSENIIFKDKYPNIISPQMDVSIAPIVALTNKTILLLAAIKFLLSSLLEKKSSITDIQSVDLKDHTIIVNKLLHSKRDKR